jgi:FAD/FMN-containing dehydrogenase
LLGARSVKWGFTTVIVENVVKITPASLVSKVVIMFFASSSAKRFAVPAKSLISLVARRSFSVRGNSSA